MTTAIVFSVFILVWNVLLGFPTNSFGLPIDHFNANRGGLNDSFIKSKSSLNGLSESQKEKSFNVEEDDVHSFQKQPLTLKSFQKGIQQFQPKSYSIDERKKVKDRSDLSEISPKFVKYYIGEKIRLHCSIPHGPYLVMWNKLGLDYPLTIGKNRFSPDERIQLEHGPPHNWTLLISGAKLTDAGVYSCTTSGASSKSNHGKICSRKTGNNSPCDTEDDGNENSQQDKKGITEYYVTVAEPELNDRSQVDYLTKGKTIRKKQISITGPIIVFYGTPLELICRASFPSDEAKLNPKITLEWYHRGIRRRPQATQTRGVYITEKWIDSHILESRLLISKASEGDAGQWICLDRSSFTIGRGMLLYQPNKKIEGEPEGNQINLSPMQPILPKVNTQISPGISQNSDIEFDQLDVMVIDLPDPTLFPTYPTENLLPAYMNDQAYSEGHSNTGHLRLARRQSNGGIKTAQRTTYFMLNFVSVFLLFSVM